MRKVLLAFLVSLLSLHLQAGEWHTFTDVKGRKLIGKVLEIESDFVLIEIKDGGRQLPIDLVKLSEEDREYLANYEKRPTEKPAASGDGDGNDGTAVPDGEPRAGRLYPLSRDEIRTGIREIEKRPKEKSISKEVHEATNRLNIYRFLCGVPSNVEADAGFSESAEDAALACKKNGGLSHSIGHSTDKCNLSSVGDVVASVGQYIEDGGDNNREVRGHREWCLNPPMGKVGFGSGGDSYSAMWCMDGGGKPAKGIWTYPGRGLFPLEYMHGNAWSLYGTTRPNSPDKLKIEIFRLPKRPDKPYNSTEKIPGREIKVNHVSFGMSAINFEPDEPAKRGIYWVRVKSVGVSEGYVVELY